MNMVILIWLVPIVGSIYSYIKLYSVLYDSKFVVSELSIQLGQHFFTGS